MNGQLLLRPEQAAQILNIGRSKVYELILSGGLPSIRVGRCRRIPTSALTTWIDEQVANAERQAK